MFGSGRATESVAYLYKLHTAVLKSSLGYSRFVAQSGRPNRAAECPLLGVKQTSQFQSLMSAFDPKPMFCASCDPRRVTAIPDSGIGSFMDERRTELLETK
jgi:hypothetical protein